MRAGRFGTGRVLRREGVILTGVSESQYHVETVMRVVNGDATNQLGGKVEG